MQKNDGFFFILSILFYVFLFYLSKQGKSPVCCYSTMGSILSEH